jgi:hypothetical protein
MTIGGRTISNAAWEIAAAGNQDVISDIRQCCVLPEPKGFSMKIRAGYEVSYDCPQPTPMILTLSLTGT